MIKLLGKPLAFGDKEQMLICRWLDEDYRAYSKMKFLKSLTEHNDKLKQIDTLNEEKRWKDKYNKDLIDIKIQQIVDEIVKPMVEARKVYYETYFKSALAEKRQIAKTKLEKKFKRECLLDF